MTSEEIFAELFAGKRVTVKLPAEGYNPLRVALTKRASGYRAVGLTDDSLCAEYDPAEKTAKFWLGPRRRRASSMSYTILSAEECDNTSQSGTD